MPAVDLDLANFASEWHAQTLKGHLQAYVRREGSDGSLARVVKTTATYLRKGLVSHGTLRCLVAEVETESVDDFRSWRDYQQRRDRFCSMMTGLSDLLKQ